MSAVTAVGSTELKRKFEEILGRESDAAVKTFRRRAFEAFESMGFPTVREENWKYTSVARVAGRQWDVAPTDDTQPIDADAMAVLDRFGLKRNGFAALNAAFAPIDVIRIPRDTRIDEPILRTISAPAEQASFSHTIVIAEAGSKATVAFEYTAGANAITDHAVQIVVEDNASLTHYRVQRDADTAFHYSVTEAELGRGSSYDATNIDLGGSLSRHDADVKFTAESGEAWVDGLFLLDDDQHHDTHSIIDHKVPNCTSHQTYRGVLNGSSRGVFNGIVYVRENAHGTDAEQSNKNLLLSNDARVDTKPQLEIYNDDVKCSHGATVGQLEEEELFYLLTRGLPEPLARNLLVYGFAGEIINKIKISDVRDELDRAVLNRLHAEIEVK